MRTSIPIPVNSIFALPTWFWLIAVTLSGCGGSTQVAGDIGTGGSGATPPTTIAVGPVNGFGSIVVTGVRYENSAAQLIVPDDDDAGTGLKLGMVVRVEGNLNADGVSGVASRIDMGADVRGPVTAVDTKAGSFAAMAVTVRVNSGTVFDGVMKDLSDLQPGDNVQVHGLLNDQGALVATRVQRRAACSGTACVYKTIGYVSSASSATQLTLGNGLSLNVNAATQFKGIATPVAPGNVVRVKTDTAPSGTQGPLTALVVSAAAAGNKSASGADLVAGEVEGILANLTASGFNVSGTAVALTSSTQFNAPNTASSLANGQRVDIDGQWLNGVLQATQVKIDSGGDSGSGYEFFGPITNFVSAADFQVKGQRIDASATIDFKNGAAADLKNDRNVEVRGRIVGSTLIADRVVFK